MKRNKDIFMEVENKDDDMGYVSTKIDKEGLFFSKMTVITSIAIFLLVIFEVFHGEADQFTASRVSAYVAAVTASGAAFVTSIVWYFKKTHVSYTILKQAWFYKKVLSWELAYKKNLMRYQHELKFSDADMAKLENDGMNAKSILSGAFSDANAVIKSSVAEGTASIKKEVG